MREEFINNVVEAIWDEILYKDLIVTNPDETLENVKSEVSHGWECLDVADDYFDLLAEAIRNSECDKESIITLFSSSENRNAFVINYLYEEIGEEFINQYKEKCDE